MCGTGAGEFDERIGVAERPETNAHERLVAQRFRPYLKARDWVGINRGEDVGFGPAPAEPPAATR